MTARIPAKPLSVTPALTERLLGSIEKNPAGCWLWTGVIDTKGYGQIVTYSHSVRTVTSAHRYAYTLFVGPVAPDLTLDHLCRRPHCVNPEHLEPVTLAENIRRAAAARTTCRHGHQLDGLFASAGKSRRYCLTCNRERQRKLRMAAARKAAP